MAQKARGVHVSIPRPATGKGFRDAKPKTALPAGMEAHYPAPGKTSVLIITPPYPSRPARLHGPSYIAGTLRDPSLLAEIRRGSSISLPEETPDFHVRLLDLSVAPEDFDLKTFLARFNPTILGVTATTPIFHLAARIAHLAKIAAPNALRVVGGYHVSAVPQRALQNSTFQIGAVGYGEETMGELAMCMYHLGRTELMDALSRIPGIAYKDRQGKIQVNPRREHFLALDSFPFPHTTNQLSVFNEYPEKLKGRNVGFVLGARGCPFRCKYCSSESMHGGRIRFRSAANILAEIEELVAMGKNFIVFEEETFTIHQEVRTIVAGLRAIKGRFPAFEWDMETRGDRLDTTLLDEMADSGLTHMAFGVETGDQALAREIKNDPRLSMASILAATEAAQAQGISVAYNVMVGLPGQDWKSLLQTARLIRLHPPARGAVGSYRFYPGSPYYRTLVQEGRARVRGQEGALEKLEFPHMTEGEIKCAAEDLEFLFYYTLLARQQPPEDQRELKLLAEGILDKFRIWTIYDLLLTSEPTGLEREHLLRKTAKSADPLFSALLAERGSKDITFFALKATANPNPQQIYVAGWFEKYTAALKLTPTLKQESLDPFLSAIRFKDAAAVARFLFSSIRAFVLTATSLAHNLNTNFGAEVKVVQVLWPKEGAATLKEKLAGKGTEDINKAQRALDQDALRNGETVSFMGINIRFNEAEQAIIIEA